MRCVHNRVGVTSISIPVYSRSAQIPMLFNLENVELGLFSELNGISIELTPPLVHKHEAII